ncbi:MAG TPA: hypothetical protein VLT45_15275 [Kofleriaceae bacterium]|nr:hypothetical protein [Kofleriaceae bacterium]
MGLPKIANRTRRRELLVETIDGEAASASRWNKGLVAAGARIDYRGLVVRGLVTTPVPPPEPEDEPDDEEADA